LKNHIRPSSGLSNPTLYTAPTRSGGINPDCIRNCSPSFNSADSSTDHGTTVVFNHHESPHASTPTTHTGIVIRNMLTPAARNAVSSFARCSFPSTNINDTSSASGSTSAR